MRGRAVVAVVSLLLPATAHAQRFPLPGSGRRGPAQPVPLSPVPASIARQLRYRRLPISVESYPLITHVQAPGVSGPAAWTSLGAGTRAEYRLTPVMSATVDLTSSLAGSPLVVQTAEMGMRVGPQRSDRFDGLDGSESRLFPFVDVRVGYIAAYSAGLASIGVDPLGGVPVQGIYASRYSTGFGAAAGVGLEYSITRRFSLTAAGTAMRSHMTPHDFVSTRGLVPGFAMTTYRYTLGVKFNPVRTMLP